MVAFIFPILVALSLAAADARVQYQCAEKAPSRLVATLGITLCTARPTEVGGITVEGALITAIQKDGVADREGLRPGDVAYKISDELIKTAEVAAERLKSLRVEGDTVVNFFRNGSPYLVHLRRR